MKNKLFILILLIFTINTFAQTFSHETKVKLEIVNEEEAPASDVPILILDPLTQEVKWVPANGGLFGSSLEGYAETGTQLGADLDIIIGSNPVASGTYLRLDENTRQTWWATSSTSLYMSGIGSTRIVADCANGFWSENEFRIYDDVGTLANGVRIKADNVSGTDIFQHPDLAGDGLATYAVEADASGFDGNLTTTDNTLQEIAQKLDDLEVGGSLPNIPDDEIMFGSSGAYASDSNFTFDGVTLTANVGLIKRLTSETDATFDSKIFTKYNHNTSNAFNVTDYSALDRTGTGTWYPKAMIVNDNTTSNTPTSGVSTDYVQYDKESTGDIQYAYGRETVVRHRSNSNIDFMNGHTIRLEVTGANSTIGTVMRAISPNITINNASAVINGDIQGIHPTIDINAGTVNGGIQSILMDFDFSGTPSNYTINGDVTGLEMGTDMNTLNVESGFTKRFFWNRSSVISETNGLILQNVTNASILAGSSKTLINKEFASANYSPLFERITETGTTGSKVVNLGDYDSSANETSIIIDDENENISIGSVPNGNYIEYDAGGIGINSDSGVSIQTASFTTNSDSGFDQITLSDADGFRYGNSQFAGFNIGDDYDTTGSKTWSMFINGFGEYHPNGKFYEFTANMEEGITLGFSDFNLRLTSDQFSTSGIGNINLTASTFGTISVGSTEMTVQGSSVVLGEQDVWGFYADDVESYVNAPEIAYIGDIESVNNGTNLQIDSTAGFIYGNGNFTSDTLKTTMYTFATLPSTGLQDGMIAQINDASSLSWRGAAAGGGTDTAIVMWDADATIWIYH